MPLGQLSLHHPRVLGNRQLIRDQVQHRADTLGQHSVSDTHFAQQLEPLLIKLRSQFQQPCSKIGLERVQLGVREGMLYERRFRVSSLAAERDELAALGLVQQPAVVSPPQFALRIPVQRGVVAPEETQRPVRAKTDDHDLICADDAVLRAIHERRGFGQQIFAFLFLPGHRECLIK
jgi:hypothetical protein